MAGTDDGGAATAADRPDWGQVGLVILAVLVLALAAITIPALGGVGLGSDTGSGPDAGDGSGLADLGGGERTGEGSSVDGEDDPAGASGADNGVGEPGDGEDIDAADGDEAGTPDDEVAGDPSDGGVGDEPGDAPASGESDSADDAGAGDELGDSGEPGDAADVSDDADGTGDTDEFGDPEESNDIGEPGESGETGEAGAGDDSGAFDEGDVPGDVEDGREPGDAADAADAEEIVDITDDDGGDGADDTGDGVGNDGDDGLEDADEGTGDRGTDGDEGTDGGDADGESGPTYDIAFEDSPTPGSEATATVTEDGEPLEGATVFFDGEAVGTTDADGTVTGTVPYTTELEVQIAPSGATQASLVRGGGGVPGGSGTAGGGGSSVQFSGGSVGAVQQSENQTRRTFELDAETALEIDGEFVAGTERTVTATVGDNPIPDGTVLLDGEEYGTTDADGTATIEVPEARETVTIAVERDELRAERVVDVRGLSVEVSELIPLPGRTVDAAVSDGDEPIANATVLLDGEAVAETDDEGTAAVELPVASDTTIAVQYDGATAETTVDGLYRNAAILTLVAVGVLALVGRTLVRRYGLSASQARSLPARILRWARELIRTLGRVAVDTIVRLAHRLERLGRWLADRCRTIWQALRRASRWLVARPGELVDRGLAALAAVHPGRLYAAVVAAIRSVVRSLRAGTESLDSSSGDEGSDGSSADSSGDEETVRTLRDLWREFLSLVRPPRVHTKTPGEIGRHAIEKGIPEPAVRTVVDAFRDAEYGRSSPSSDRLERVRTAVRSVDGGTDSGDGEPSTASVPDRPATDEQPTDEAATGQVDRSSGDERQPANGGEDE